MMTKKRILFLVLVGFLLGFQLGTVYQRSLEKSPYERIEVKKIKEIYFRETPESGWMNPNINGEEARGFFRKSLPAFYPYGLQLSEIEVTHEGGREVVLPVYIDKKGLAMRGEDFWIKLTPELLERLGLSEENKEEKVSEQKDVIWGK